jgi:hypothetical protein
MKLLLSKKSKSITLLLSLLILSSCGKESNNIFDSKEVQNTILEEEAKSNEYWSALVLSKEDLYPYMGDGLVEAGDGPLSIITNRDYDFVESFVACVRDAQSLWGVSLEIEWYGTAYVKSNQDIGSIKAATTLAYTTNKEGFTIDENLLDTGKCLVKPMGMVVDSIGKAYKAKVDDIVVSELKPISIDKNIYALKFTSKINNEKFGKMPVNLYYIISYKDTLLIENFIISIETKDNSKKDDEIIMSIIESKYDSINSETEPSSLDKKESTTPEEARLDPTAVGKENVDGKENLDK